ncbi:MAG: hypothetical protein IPL63_06070 [Saprospiraceae bacterium]|nr:hypothetical protein [Saprospiraceae bacterium]
MEHLYQNVVKISCDVEQGSGILFYPKEGPYIIIISAKHVLNKEDICNYKIENISVSFGGFINVNLNKSLGDQFLFDDEFDLGAIVILKSRINENITINFLKAVDRKFDFKSCVSLGYPEKNKNDIKSIKSTYRAQLESTNFIFESVLSEEYLEELSSSSFDNLVGMSGGGLFYHNSSEYYLSGINFEFRNGYKSFYTINILKVNEFLEKNKLSKIPLTYGSANGINSNWINTKHSQALKELGERYTNEIESLEVPIVQYFKYLELGRTFTEDIELHFHQFILTLRSSKNVLNNDTTKDFFDKTSIFSDFLVRNFKELNWIVGGFDNSVLPLDELEKYRIGVRKTIEELRVEKLNILNKRIQVAKKGGKNIDTYHDNPLSDELNALYKIENDLDQFIKYLNGDKIKIGQNGLLVITGNAGNGKSHLLGDITKLRIEKDLPSILVLGEKLQGNNNPREQILNILSLGLYSWQELLINLNEIGKFKGERFIFAIDALNEGNGRNIWPVYLASFIDEFKNYPYIGLVLSIRSTYLNVILPEAKFNNNEIVKIEHRGFQGMGLKALSHFCKCFNLNQPVLPLLSPEFTNPQFLLLTCKTLKMLGRNDFPRGMQGISKLYKDYTVAVTQKFRLNLNYDIPITLDIVEHFIFFIQSKLPGVKKLDDVYMAFEEYSYKSLVPHLINDLIRENILVKNWPIYRQKNQMSLS